MRSRTSAQILSCGSRMNMSRVSETPPSTKWTLGSNAVHLTARRDPRTGRVLAIAALDNLVKGAAGQMIQCANLMLGLDETAGLPVAGVYP